MVNSFDQTALQTISLLEARLRRIEFVISGDVEKSSSVMKESATISERLTTLENSLHELVSSSKTIQNLLSLYATHPELFNSTASDSISTRLDSTHILSMIMASASLFSATASRLSSVADVPPPSADLSAKLIEQQPHISKIAAIQSNQLKEIKNLRARDVILLERWYKISILQAGEAWADLDTRLRRVEQNVKRASQVKQKDSIFSET
ncbi:hypothetical protein K3495_g7076 [Podosphaera aphanis]|nr:hypothetical protein K3495_g7076 [Podosphaera aphanis]